MPDSRHVRGQAHALMVQRLRVAAYKSPHTPQFRRCRGGQYAWVPVLEWAVRVGLLSRQVLVTGRAVARYADHRTGGDVRPTWDRLRQDTGLSRATVARHLRALRTAGLLEHVTRGTRRAGAGNLAAEYALTVPRRWDEARLADLEAAVAAADTQAEAGEAEGPAFPGAAESSPGPSRGQDEGTGSETPPTPSLVTSRTDPAEGCPDRARAREAGAGGGRRPPSPGTRRWRRWRLAERVRARVLVLCRVRVGELASALREVAGAGWTVEDVVEYLETRDVALRVRHPLAWLRYRLLRALEHWPVPPSLERARAREREALERARLRAAWQAEERVHRARVVKTEDRSPELVAAFARLRERLRRDGGDRHAVALRMVREAAGR